MLVGCPLFLLATFAAGTAVSVVAPPRHGRAVALGADLKR